MRYLTEDPYYLLIGLVLAALGCLLAMKVTQQGKFLIWAGVLAALAAGLFGFERLYVTDSEQVEAVVYDLARAVESSDVDRIKSHLDDKVTFGMQGRTMDAALVLRVVLPLLRQSRFDFIRVGQLSTAAGGQTRRGSAEFKVSASGVFNQGGSELPLVVAGSNCEWSLGFIERAPGDWKITRITAIKLPTDVSKALFMR